MTLHIVLDHSALIPCGDKPGEEKEAIRELGDLLPEFDAVWYVSRKYLKTLYSVLHRSLKNHHPLPKLQRFLIRNLEKLLELANTRTWLCRHRNLVGGLGLHVVARSAADRAKSAGIRPGELKGLGLGDDDVEVLAIAAVVLGRGEDPLYVVTTDRTLLDVARMVRLDAKILTPRQLIEQLRPKD